MLLVLLLIMCHAALFGDIPEMISKGSLYTETKGYFYQTDRYFDCFGKRQKSTYPFLIRGVLEDLRLGFSSKDNFLIRFGYLSAKERINGDRSGLSDVDIGIRHSINSIFSFVVWGVIPPCVRYRAPIHYGRFGFEVGVLGYSYQNFLKYLYYHEGYFGFRLYEGFVSNQLRGYWKFGFFPKSWCKFLFSAHYVGSVERVNFRYDESLFLLNPGYSLCLFSLQVEIFLSKSFVLFSSLDRHVFGKKVGADGSYTFGVYSIF